MLKHFARNKVSEVLILIFLENALRPEIKTSDAGLENVS